MNAFRGSFGSEWIKLWTVRATWWALGSALFLMALAAAVMGGDFASDVRNGEITDGTTMAVAEPAANAALIAQFGLLAFAMSAVTAEFTTGAIRGTLAVDPRRSRVLAAKTLAVVAVVLPLAVVLALTGLLAGDATLGEYGTGGGELGDAAAISLYFVLGAVFTVGIAALLRSAVGTLSLVTLVLLGLPMIFGTGWSDCLPGGAGLALLGSDDPPYGRAGAAALFAAWAAAAQLAGHLALRRRDV